MPCSANFSMTLQTDFLKQIIILESFNSLLLLTYSFNSRYWDRGVSANSADHDQNALLSLQCFDQLGPDLYTLHW